VVVVVMATTTTAAASYNNNIYKDRKQFRFNKILKKGRNPVNVPLSLRPLEDRSKGNSTVIHGTE